MSSPALDTVHAIARHQHGFITREQAREAGVTESQINHALERGHWSRTFPAVYRVTSAPSGDEKENFAERLASARLHLGPEAIAIGETAAALWGLQGLPGRYREIHLALEPGRERDQLDGVRLHTLKMPSGTVTDLNGERLTSIQRTVCDALLGLPRMNAVSVADSALNLRLLGAGDLRNVEALMYRRRGAVRGRTLLRQADGRAQSPLETRARLVATDAGLAPTELQVPVRSRDGRTLGYGDMGWRKRDGWLIAECDGVDVHSTPEALLHDRRRANSFILDADCPVEVVRYTWADVVRPAYFVTSLRAGLAA